MAKVRRHFWGVRVVHLVAMSVAMAWMTSSAGAVTFQDGDFDTGWTETILFDARFGDLSGSSSTFPQGGGGNPDKYLAVRTVTDFYPSDYNKNIWNFQMFDGAVCNPGSQGAILSIDYSEDTKAFDGSDQVYGAALLQNATFYYILLGVADDYYNWVSNSHPGLTQNDFVAFGDETAHPDFSAAGTPITFGFVRMNRNAWYQDACLDNWQVTVHTNPVPLPGALLLVGSGLLPLLWRRRRSQ